MLSDIIMSFSLLVILLIIASFLIISRHNYLKRMPTVNTQIQSHPLERRVKMNLEVRDGKVVYVERPASPNQIQFSQSWYKNWRMLVSLGFVLMIVLTFFGQSALADGPFQSFGNGYNFWSLPHYSGMNFNTAAHTASLNPSQRLVRISQLDPSQYASQDEFNTWAYSACSTASMTEVFNAYGLNLRITNVLQVEYNIGEITPTQGLLRPEGIQTTAAQFGFRTTWKNNWDLDQLISIANGGNPVIVSFPPDKYAGGHLLVVTGGDSSTIYLADSSRHNRKSLSRAQFLQWWEGFGAIPVPQ